MPYLVLVAALSAAHHAASPPLDVAGRQAPPPCAACIVLVLPPSQVGWLPSELNGLLVLVGSAPGAVEPPLLEAIRQRGGRPGLIIEQPSSAASAAPAGIAPATATVVLDIRTWSSMPDNATVFALRTALVAIRAAGPPGLELGVYPSAGMAPALAAEAGGYWDFLVADSVATGDPGRWTDAGAVVDVGNAIAVTRTDPAGRWLFRLPADEALGRRVASDLARAARWLPAGMVRSDDVAARCDGRALELFLNPGSLDRVTIADCEPGTPIVIEPAGPVERVQLSSGQALIRVPEASAGRFAADVAVGARRRLTADEIVARHQAATARQAAAVRTLISSGSLTLTFEAPGFPAPITVASTTTIYRAAAVTDIEQRDLRVNGIALPQRGIPRLPIIEAERVAAPPLAITLGDMYRYQLAGEETRAGTPCFVVAFEPRTSGGTLFKGRLWIAADDFALARIEAVQTGLRGPVVSSEQFDDFTRLEDGAWVLSRSEVSQLYQGAAYRTPIRRVLALARHEVNAPDFTARRTQAHASGNPVLRDTPDGYRYLQRAKPPAPGAVTEGTPQDVSPQVGSASSRIRTLAYGVIIDPNITRPLPFAGLSYVDFNLFGTGAQLNGFFGGSYGQVAFSVPSLGRSRWQLAGRAFGIASSYNDRRFVDGTEQYDQNIRQRPAFASAWLMRALTPRVTLRAGYELDYTHFTPSDATAAAFVVPPDQVAHGVRVALDAQRHGWDATVWWSAARRAGWRTWGGGNGEYRAGDSDFQRFGVTIARSRIVSPRLVLRGEAAAMGGRDLDRFSRYAFGTFENRLRGYPSALIRYDRGAVARTALAWSAARLMRLDLFGDAAFVHDEGFGRRLTRFTGVGTAIEAPAPFGMLVAAEWGYGLQGVNADGRRGTHVIRISGYKVF